MPFFQGGGGKGTFANVKPQAKPAPLMAGLGRALANIGGAVSQTTHAVAAHPVSNPAPVHANMAGPRTDAQTSGPGYGSARANAFKATPAYQAALGTKPTSPTDSLKGSLLQNLLKQTGASPLSKTPNIDPLKPMDIHAWDVNPLAAGWKIGRTDMGVDANAAVGTPILAPNDSKVVGVSPNWYKGQPYEELQLLKGPNKGKDYYVAEQITNLPQTGQVIPRGKPVAQYAPSGTGIEVGWGSGTPGRTLAAATTGYSEGQVTPAGQSFLNEIQHGVRSASAKAIPKGAVPPGHQLVGSGGSGTTGGRTFVVTASQFGGPGDPGTGSTGYRGDNLNQHPDSFAELSNNPAAGTSGDFSALGNLPYGTKVTVTNPANGKSLVLTKRDVGAGGSGIGGTKRAIDLWYSAAQKLGVNGLGKVKVTIGGNQGPSSTVAPSGGSGYVASSGGSGGSTSPVTAPTSSPALPAASPASAAASPTATPQQSSQQAQQQQLLSGFLSQQGSSSNPWNAGPQLSTGPSALGNLINFSGGSSLLSAAESGLQSLAGSTKLVSSRRKGS